MQRRGVERDVRGERIGQAVAHRDRRVRPGAVAFRDEPAVTLDEHRVHVGVAIDCRVDHRAERLGVESGGRRLSDLPVVGDHGVAAQRHEREHDERAAYGSRKTQTKHGLHRSRILRSVQSVVQGAGVAFGRRNWSWQVLQ